MHMMSKKELSSEEMDTVAAPGLSTNPESGSSSTSPSQDLLRREAELASRELVRLASSSSSSV